MSIAVAKSPQRPHIQTTVYVCAKMLHMDFSTFIFRFFDSASLQPTIVSMLKGFKPCWWCVIFPNGNLFHLVQKGTPLPFIIHVREGCCAKKNIFSCLNFNTGYLQQLVKAIFLSLGLMVWFRHLREGNPPVYTICKFI